MLLQHKCLSKPSLSSCISFPQYCESGRETARTCATAAHSLFLVQGDMRGVTRSLFLLCQSLCPSWEEPTQPRVASTARIGLSALVSNILYKQDSGVQFVEDGSWWPVSLKIALQQSLTQPVHSVEQKSRWRHWSDQYSKA